MIKFAKITNDKTGTVDIAIGSTIPEGFTQMDVRQSDINGNWYLYDKAPMLTPEEKEGKEREELNKLSLTAADVERAIYKSKGIDFEDILELVKDNSDIDIKALKIELKANNFYRGNPYVNAVGALLGFTTEQLDMFFETKDYRELLPVEEETEANGTGQASDISSNSPVIENETSDIVE